MALITAWLLLFVFYHVRPCWCDGESVIDKLIERVQLLEEDGKYIFKRKIKHWHCHFAQPI